jgi:hypothetical protein
VLDDVTNDRRSNMFALVDEVVAVGRESELGVHRGGGEDRGADEGESNTKIHRQGSYERL